MRPTHGREENIATFLGTKDKVTIKEVACGALDFESKRIGTAEQRLIASAMERLRWRRERLDRKTDSKGKRWWISHHTLKVVRDPECPPTERRCRTRL